MSQAWSYKPLTDPKKNFRVLEVKPWGQRFPPLPAKNFTFIPPGAAPRIQLSHKAKHASVRNPNHPKLNAMIPLKGKLLEKEIETFTQYEAVSWCWEGGKKNKEDDQEERDQDDDREHGIINLETKNGLFVPLNISTHLCFALKRLRLEKKSRFLWIDKVCIDQKNHVEKEQQIQLMANIYEASEHVCVYLGSNADDSGLVPSFIHKINRRFDGHNNSPIIAAIRQWRALAALMRRKWFTRRCHFSGHGGQLEFINLSSRVVQEIAFAKRATLYLGSGTEIDWESFKKAVWATIQREADIVRLLIEHERGVVNAHRFAFIDIRAYGAQSLMEVLRHLVKRNPNGGIERLATIGTLVSALVAYDVTETRDAIYAILRLGKDSYKLDGARKQDALIMPDYESERKHDSSWMYTTPTIKVYGKFVKFVINQSQSLDIICVPWAPELNSHDPDHRVGIPSWIGLRDKRPFKQKDGDGMYKRANADCLINPLGEKPYCATGQESVLHYKPTLEQEPHSLFIDGFQIAGISELGEICEDGNIPFEWLHMAWERDEKSGIKREAGTDIWEPDQMSEIPHLGVAWHARDGRGRNSRGFPYVSDAFWRTLVGNRTPEGMIAPAGYQGLCEFAFRKFKRQRGKRGRVFTDEVKNLAIRHRQMEYLEFIERLQAVAWNRRLMFTYNGRIGIVPGEAEIDDRICLLWGCSVPVVLRKVVKKSQEVHELIGACYVHGVMEGELLRDYPNLRERGPQVPFGMTGNTKFRIA
ncbi:hypothetical protein HYFRA_00005580 [Hymenoscyphus fraxineus]|uniref:Heterokaryon incompatibility domain-containing protein n=1 Tax=Hymenoscyphus fraxineus TaxID=746836 RepID=A0A9N9KUJ5_9HELO|nr:hypothetical protein HYFRA_00005580 [Hymenoscyphus fraxineus]